MIPTTLRQRYSRLRIQTFLRRLTTAPRVVGLGQFVLDLEAAGLVLVPGSRMHGVASVQITEAGRQAAKETDQ